MGGLIFSVEARADPTAPNPTTPGPGAPPKAAVPDSAAKAAEIQAGDELAATLDSLLEPTSGGPSGARTTVIRQSLDGDLVISIVKERLQEAGLRLGAETLTKLGAGTSRPWIRDLLVAIPKMALASPDLRGARAEDALRVIVRMVLAEMVVRRRHIDWAGTGVSDSSEARSHLADWVYWRLARLPQLPGAVAPPDCTKVQVVRPLCDLLAGLASDGAVTTKLDELTGVGMLFDAFEVVQAISNGERGPAPKVIVEALLRFNEPKLDALKTALAADLGLGADPAAFLDKWRSLTLWWEPVKAQFPRVRKILQEQYVGVKPSSSDEAAMKNFAEAVNAKVGDVASATLLSEVMTLAPELLPFWNRLSKLSSIASSWSTATAAAQLEAIELIAGLDGLSIAIDNVRRLNGDLLVLKAVIASIDVTALDAAKLLSLSNTLRAVLTDTKLLSSTMTKLVGQPPIALTELNRVLERVVALLNVGEKVVKGLEEKTLGGGISAIRSLASVSGVDIDISLLAFLSPLAEVMRTDKPLTAARLYKLLAAYGPVELSGMLGLTLDKDCSDKQSWSCWATRLALALHASIGVDGATLRIDTEVILSELTKLGVDKRREKTWEPYLHLAVGGGLLYGGKDNAPPLIAEQIGVGVTVHREGPFAARFALFGSGLLYRFALDSEESDGVMVGAAFLLGVYDLAELYAGGAVLYEPSMNGSDGNTKGVLLFGVQVPLSDYLSRL